MTLRIRLEYEHEIVAEIGDDELDGELIVGRSRECAWTTPPDDIAVGRQHIRLFRKGRSVMLEDLGSRNGSFIDGKRIRRPLKLREGQRIAIGKSVIVVDKKKAGDGKPRFQPCLEVRSGLRKGVRLPVGPKGVRIGSDPQSELVLLDDLLVSRHHAFVGYNEGVSCWIEDAGSMNGTFVDGEKLAKGRRRPLKPGNMIQLAHIDILYADGAQLQKRSRLWRSIAVAAAALAVAYGGFLAYQRTLIEDVETIMASTRAAAADARFREAKQILRQAASARGYSKARDEVEELRSLLNSWRETATRWNRAETILRERSLWESRERVLENEAISQLVEDLNYLSGFTSRRDWEWNPAYSEIYIAQTRAAKRLVDGFLALEGLIREQDLDRERLTREMASLDEAVQHAEEEKDTAEITAWICRVTRETRQETALLIEDMDRMNALLESIANEWPPPLPQVVRRFEAFVENGLSSVRRRAQVLLPALQSLEQAHAQLQNCTDALRNMHFADARIPIDLPSRELCAPDARTSLLRDKLAHSGEAVRHSSIQAEAWHRRTQDALKPFGGAAGLINRWSDPALFAGLKRFDCLDEALPRRMREKPISSYDRITGIEPFYEALRRAQRTGEQRPWEPELFQLAQAFQTVDAALTAFDKEDLRWALADDMGDYAEQLRRVSVFRGQMKTDLLKQASRLEGREGLLVAGMALIVAPNPDDLKMDGIPLRDWVRDRLAKSRAQLVALDREYLLASPERQIEIRTEILRIGLPGDPMVRQYWARRMQ